MKKRMSIIVAMLFSISLLFGCGGGAPAPQQQAAQPNDHGHDHGDLPFEWSGELELAEGTYKMIFEFSGDPSMDIAFAIMDGTIADLEHHGHHIMEAEMEEVSPGSTFTALPDFGFTLLLNQDGPTEFSFVIEEAGRYMIFTEHMPEEFNLVFLNEAGEELVPENQKEYDEDHDHGHSHGDLPFEWSGEVELKEGTYTLEFGHSHDPSIEIAFVLMDGSITDFEHYAHHILEEELEEVSVNGSFLMEPDYGYRLILDHHKTVTSFTVTEAGRYMIFMEHMPEEFDLQLKDASGTVLVFENEVEYDDHGHTH